MDALDLQTKALCAPELLRLATSLASPKDRAEATEYAALIYAQLESIEAIDAFELLFDLIAKERG